MEGYRWPAKPLVWFALATLLYAGIFCWIGLARMPDPNLIPREGIVSGVAAEDGGSYLLLKDAKFSADGKEYDIDGVQLWAEGTEYVYKGQTVTAHGSLGPVENRNNPGAFDNRRYLFTKGIGYVLDGRISEIEGEASYTIFERLQQNLMERIHRLWPDHGELLGMLLLGEGELDPTLYDSYRVSGAAHVLAVSGLHVGFVAAFLSVLLCFLPKRSLARCLLLCLGLLIYCLLTGASASTQRACLMAAMVWAAGWRGREADGVSALSLAVGAILLLNPRQLLGLSFQLSVSAMLGIVLLRSILEKGLKALPGFLRTSVAMTLAAQIGCLPAMLISFGSLSIYSPLTNLLAVPLAGFAVPLGLCTLLLDWLLPGLTPLPALLCKLCVQGMNLVAEGFASMPLAQLLLPTLPSVLGILWPLLLLGLSELRGKIRLCASLFAGLSCALVLGLWIWGLFPANLEITFLSVGCADSAILRKGGTTVVVDTGRSGRETLYALQAEDPVVDTLILTHGDQDHSGGTETLLQNLTVREVCYPKGLERDEDFFALLQAAKAQGAQLRPVAAGETLWYDGFELQVLWPVQARVGYDNEDSLVLLVKEDEGGSALLTADVGKESLSGFELPKADVVKLPHHGSADGLTSEQILRLEPKMAVLSVGPNGYGLPDSASLEALGNTTLYRTDEDGAIRVRFGEEIQVETFAP